MTGHYHDPNDVSLLPHLKDLAPKEYEAWVALEKVIGRADGTLPQKYRELIALAVGIATLCPYCIEAHTRAAKKAGASANELAEASFIAAAVRAGAGGMHGAMALKFYEGSKA